MKRYDNAPREVTPEVPSRALSDHESSSHKYSVINLAENAQAILGDVHGLDHRFFRDPGHTDAKASTIYQPGRAQDEGVNLPTEPTPKTPTLKSSRIIWTTPWAPVSSRKPDGYHSHLATNEFVPRQAYISWPRDTASIPVEPADLTTVPAYDEHQYLDTDFASGPFGFAASPSARPQDPMQEAGHSYGNLEISGRTVAHMGDIIYSSPSPPTLESFKAQIAAHHPMLPPYLLERLAHGQVQRYARLLNDIVNHAACVSARSCTSGRYCHATGGRAELLPAQSSEHDAASFLQFRAASNPDSDNDDSAYDGIVTPAMFPNGVPLPPTTKLPARVECPLCFQVKTFQKPSDWTKHVDEDLRPYICTFPTCPEPKTFKRSVDWVRHENERHRHLEWWKCNHVECGHICYRMGNFIQHLVREHKLREPKLQRRLHAEEIPKSAAQKFDAGEQEFWDRVDSCYH